MIKLPLIVLILGLTFSTEMKADSLVCFYSGTTTIMSIYTETSNSKEYRAIKSTVVLNDWSRVTFYGGDDMYFSNAIPCIEIEDVRNETTNLNKFLNQIESRKE